MIIDYKNTAHNHKIRYSEFYVFTMRHKIS